MLARESILVYSQAQSKLIVTVLWFSILASIFLRVDAITSKVTLTGDEGISYLTATCHKGRFTPWNLGEQPAPASRWKAHLQVEEKLCFQEISATLARSDIHPPLYFWLLHLWVSVMGVSLWSGPLLNVLFASLTTVSLFSFANLVLRTRRGAALVTFTYALNYSVILISVEARHYDLLTLCTLLLVWATVRYVSLEESSLRDGLVLMLLTAAGGLTHYQFIFPISACVVFLIVRLRRNKRMQLCSALLGIGSGCALAFLIHPYTFTSSKKILVSFGMSLASFQLRLLRLAASPGMFYYVIVLLVPVLFWILIHRLKKPILSADTTRLIDLAGSYVLFFPFWMGAGIIFLYLLSISPLHAMSAKYLGLVWPFFSFVPAFILRLVRYRPPLLLYLTLSPLVLCATMWIQWHQYLDREVDDFRSVVNSAEVVMVDTVSRGILSMILWHVPDDAAVIVADQDSLLERPDSWLNDFAGGGVYVSELSEMGSQTKRNEIIRVVALAGHEVVQIDGGIWGVGTVFKISER